MRVENGYRRVVLVDGRDRFAEDAFSIVDSERAQRPFRCRLRRRHIIIDATLLQLLLRGRRRTRWSRLYVGRFIKQPPFNTQVLKGR